MSDFLEEIKEDLTREKYALIWHKFGNYVIGAAVAVLILTGLGVAAKNYTQSRYETYSDLIFEAGRAPEAEAIKKYDDVINHSNGTYQAIAGLRKASILLQGSKNQEALDTYRKIIEKSSSPQELKDVAKLLYLAVSSNILAENKDYKDAYAANYMQENIDGSGIFKYSAMEISAFKEMDNHNYKKARDIFSKLADSEEAPQTIRARASEMLVKIENTNVINKENATENKNG
jgi:hypothetical protein